MAEKGRGDAVSFLDKGDISNWIDPGTERVQSLNGFDDEYVDIVDYILRCTHKIWEEHGVGVIYSHYADDIEIWTSDGRTYGVEAVVAGTARVQAAFPDVRLFGDDVIWSGNDREGFHTSHRISWTARNTGHSIYGPPTGTSVYRYGIANCLVKENRIVEEWIARDELGLVLQLGFDPWESAAKSVRADRNAGRAPWIAPDEEMPRVRGGLTPEPYPPPLAGAFDPEYFVRRSLHEVWNRRMVHDIDGTHVPNYRYHGTTGRELYGRSALKAYVLSLFAAFPDLSATMDHVYRNGDEREGYRVMTRWTMEGTHTGPGIYGEPTGKRIKLMVIGHQHIKDGRFVREWSVFDEFALLKQLYTPEVHGEYE